jgi:rhamnosyltransferase
VEVILVDSRSTDHTVEIAASFGAMVVPIPTDEFTFNRSLNLGLEAVQAPIVIIASAHVNPVYPDWLGNMIVPYADSKIVLTYGKQRDGVSTKFSERQISSQCFPEHSDPRQTHSFCNNAKAAIRHAVWQRHAYDETLTRLEDVAWANWALHEGHSF